MKIVITTVLVSCIILSAYSEEQSSSLSLKLRTDASMSVVDYSDNWEGDESGLISWIVRNNVNVNAYFGKFKNRSELNLSFGQNKVNEEGKWFDFSKSVDIISLENVLSYNTKVLIDPYLALHFESQLIDSRDTSITYYLNPVDNRVSSGFSIEPVKSNSLSILTRLGAAIRHKYDKSIDNSLITECGVESITNIDLTLLKDIVHYTGRLGFFQSFVELNSNSDNRYPELVFDNRVDIRILEYFSINLSYDLKLDFNKNDYFRYKQLYALSLKHTIKL